MKLSPYFSVPVVLTIGVLLAGCTAPSPSPSSVPSASASPSPDGTETPVESEAPEETPVETEAPVDGEVPVESEVPEDTEEPVSTPAPDDALVDAGFKVGEEAQALAEESWPEDIPVIDFGEVVSAQTFEAKGSSNAVLTVSISGGDVNAVEPFLASLEGSGLAYLDTYEADGVSVNYYESSDYFLEVITTPADQPDSGGYAGTTRFKITSKAILQ